MWGIPAERAVSVSGIGYGAGHAGRRRRTPYRPVPAGHGREDRLEHAHVQGRGEDVRHAAEDETSIAVRCPKEERDELVLAEPEKFWVADHEAQFAWIRVRLATLEDEAELRDILADSWRQAAPPRLLDHTRSWGLRPGTDVRVTGGQTGARPPARVRYCFCARSAGGNPRSGGQRDVAQLGSALDWGQGVAGSNPVVPTSFIAGRRPFSQSWEDGLPYVRTPMARRAGRASGGRDRVAVPRSYAVRRPPGKRLDSVGAAAGHFDSWSAPVRPSLSPRAAWGTLVVPRPTARDPNEGRPPEPHLHTAIEVASPSGRST